MTEIVIISGKGGAGKTSLTAAFAHLARNKTICDLDVDAPDLHLLLDPEHEQEHDFYSGNLAIIDPDKCSQCGLCAEMCRYDAVSPTETAYAIEPLKCEGCKVCVEFCPEEAVAFPEKHCGGWYVSRTRFGELVHAQLFPGEENSGRLVALLRQKARELSEAQGRDLILCDGAPGIGCPVISSLTGTDLAVVVTEPTPSGRHDLERVVGLCAHFKIPMAIVINKYDINLEQTALIEEFCRDRDIPLLARLPHDRAMTKAMVQGQTITEYQSGELADMIRRAWQEVESMAGLA